MKKQSGFTLIELMVVMAIIAILATAGLSAYTGYIKKARDTRRIADMATINTIILGSMTTNGRPPQDGDILTDAILASNNGKPIWDPLTKSDGTTKGVCLSANGASSNEECLYVYGVCDGGSGYMIGSYLESKSNLSLYTQNASGVTNGPEPIYDIGSCKDRDGFFDSIEWFYYNT